MKKLTCIILLIFMTFNMSSCVIMYSLNQLSFGGSEDLNTESVYTPYADDFSTADGPLGTICTSEGTYFSPAEDSLYYISYDSIANEALYRADENGTECIAKSGTGKLSSQSLDPWFKVHDDKVYFTSYDSLTVSRGFLYCYNVEKKATELMAKTDVDYYYCDIYDNCFVYSPYVSDDQHSDTFPHCLYSLMTLDFDTGKSKDISKDNVLDFEIINGKVIFITYDDKKINVSSCNADGSDIKLIGTIDFEFNYKYGYVNTYSITENYVVLWGDTGVGESETDLVVFSLEDKTTKEYQFPLYSGVFAACGNYGFISFCREEVDVYTDTEPMENEGIYRIDLATGEKELVSEDLAFCTSLLAFSEDCVYATKTKFNEYDYTYKNEITRVSLDKDATLVYSYEE